MYQKVKEMVDTIYPQLIAIRRDLHQHPELGLEEYRTSALVLDYLQQWNIKVTQLIGETAIVGLIEGNPGEKTIGLRAARNPSCPGYRQQQAIMLYQKVAEQTKQSAKIASSNLCASTSKTECLLGMSV